MSLNGIEITDVVVFPIKNPQPDSKLVAFAKVILNGQFIITGIRLVNGSKGLFLGFPQNYDKSSQKAYDICFPVTSELRDAITSAVIHKYKDGSGEGSSEESQAGPDFDESQAPAEGFQKGGKALPPNDDESI